MNRRNFLRLIPAVITAGVIAPKLLIPKEGPIKPVMFKNGLSTIRNNYIIGCDPINTKCKNYMGIVILKKRRCGYSYLYQTMEAKYNHEELLKQLYVHYRNYNFSMMNIQSYIK